MQLAGESPESISSYVFSALTSIIQEGHIMNTCPSWVLSILQLPIFPVATKHGTVEITTLSPNIFVPNSELLNPLFAGKVNLLNFGDNYVRDIIPLLKCSGVDLKYLSTYNDPETMAVKLLQPVRDEVIISRDLFRKKEELTRLIQCRVGI